LRRFAQNFQLSHLALICSTMKLAIKLAKALCEASNSATWARFWSPINPNKVTVVINNVTNTSIRVKP
jgi:hypothetical protein